MFYTIYKITNKINGNFYIGKHQTKNLDDGYMGSGKLIKAAIKKHGIENFTKEILHVFETENDMNEAEKELVILGEGCYNLCPGGSGGFGYINEKKLNNVNHDSIDVKNKLISSMKEHYKNPINKKRINLQTKYAREMGNCSAGYFGNRGDLDKEIINKAMSSESIIKRKETYKKIGHQAGIKNSQYGRPKSEETKIKIRNALLKSRAKI